MFDGEKVTLRQFELTDLNDIAKYWNTISLRRELGTVVPKSLQDLEEWIRNTWVEKQAGRGYFFAIVDKKTKELLGYCSLKNVRNINRSATVTIAIFDERNRGKGFGTDAMKVLLLVGFGYLNFHRIGLNVFETNSQAIKVYEKVGFKKVGLQRETDFIDGKYVNDVIMDILEDEWRQLYQV
ncbi:MAG: GNAT family N-acetyltransferase [Candidatus Thorarchaeota archaeon]